MADDVPVSAAVPVTIALPAYHHTYEIAAGIVALAGMEATFVAPHAADADIIELALAEYVARRLAGDETLTAVPVFPARAFMHSWIHLGDPESPVLEPSTTASVYARGLLADRGESASGLVIAPRSVLRDVAGLRPRFEEPAIVERDDYARTGVHPILSVIAVRSDLLTRERWLASNLFRAFEVARRHYFARLEDIRGSRVPIPSVAGHLQRLRDVFGDNLWPYGLPANRITLDTFLRYADQQGVIQRPCVHIPELFADVEPFVDFTDGL